MSRTLLIIAALYVVLRGLVVLALGDVFFYGEELEKGAVASALLQGVDVPYARLPYHPYEGGGFVASHLKAVMFALVGTNVLAHKLAALIWGLLILGATVALAARHAGRGAAWVAGLLLVLGPAHLQKQSLLHLGIHYEALLFVALVLDLGLRVAATPEGEKPPAKLLAGLGLAAGFGTYFSYQVPTAVLAVIVLLARTGWRRILAPPLVIGTVVGLLPLARMAAAVGGEVVDIHGAEVGGGGGLSRLIHGLGAGLGDPLGWIPLVLGATAAVAGLRCVPARDERRRALSLLLGFAALWSLVAATTGMVPPLGDEPHWVRFVRFAPLVWALLLSVAVAAGPALERASAPERGRAQFWARGATIGFLALGSWNALALIREGDLGSAGRNLALLRRTSGIEVRGALVKIAPRLENTDTADAARRAADSITPFAGIDDARIDFVAAELAAAACQLVGGATPEEMVEALVAATGGRFGRDALRLGTGSVVLRSIGGDVRGALSDPSFDGIRAEALGRFGSGFLSLEPYFAGELATVAGTPLEAAYLRGLGRRVLRCAVMGSFWGKDLRLQPERARAHLAQIAREAGTGEAGVEALLHGFDGAAHDFGLDASTLPR